MGERKSCMSWVEPPASACIQGGGRCQRGSRPPRETCLVAHGHIKAFRVERRVLLVDWHGVPEFAATCQAGTRVVSRAYRHIGEWVYGIGFVNISRRSGVWMRDQLQTPSCEPSVNQGLHHKASSHACWGQTEAPCTCKPPEGGTGRGRRAVATRVLHTWCGDCPSPDVVIRALVLGFLISREKPRARAPPLGLRDIRATAGMGRRPILTGPCTQANWRHE
jgi:hypothetical protein